MKKIMFFSAALALALPVMAMADGPTPVKGILYAQEFEANQPMEFFVGGEKTDITEGYILVLDVPLDVVQPRNALMPVLMINDAIAIQVNSGYIEGKVIAIVPKVDLKAAKIWYAAPFNLYAVNEDVVNQAVEARDQAKISAMPAEAIEEAIENGGEEVFEGRDYNHVYFQAGQLIKEYAPAETDRADSLLPF
jgi:hypothetical protein